MLSHLSAPQTPGLKPCVCPGPSGPGTLRFSRLPADARRTRIPPAPGRFRPYFHEEESRKNLDMLPKEWYGKNSYTTDGFKWN